MNPYIHPRFKPLIAIAKVLAQAAREAGQQLDAHKPRARRGATLRPSMETPLWRAVVTMVKPCLRRHGDRALLARELGVHRARIGEFFGRQTAMPDAERTLRLLVWISRHANKPTAGVTHK
jgi:hypothetical protein